MKKQVVFGVILMVLLLAAQSLAGSVKLVENGQSAFSILLYEVASDVKTKFSPLNPTPFDNYANQGFEPYAAEELKNYLYLMTGSQLVVREISNKAEADKMKPYIAIGKLANDLGAVPPKSKYGIDGHIIDVAQDKVLLAGETPLASYYAAVHLLEILGCRWYMPGELGEIVPKQKTLTMQVGVIEEVPDLWSRRLWYSGGKPDGFVAEEEDRFTIWNLRNRQFGMIVDMNHAWNRVLPPKDNFNKHPEWFSLINGERRAIQLCTTNQEMITQFVENYKVLIRKEPQRIWWSLSPNDGAAFCECVNCKALDPGINDVVFTNLPQVTDRLVIFFNQVVAEIVKEFPDKYFAFYAYVNHTAPPTKVKLHPHLLPVITPISFSRYHEMNSPNSETQRALAKYVKEWAQRADFILYYGYAYNLADQILPYTKEHQIRHDWPFMFENKLAGVCIESQKSWPHMLPWYYMMAKLNVDMDTDLDTVAKEFYRDFFGKAAPQMEQYISLLDQAYANLKWEMGNMWFAHLLFTPEFMNQAQSLINQALVQAAGDQLIIKRIEMFGDPLKIASKFLEMREMTLKADFVGASKKAGEIISLGTSIYEHNPEAITMFSIRRYVHRFWKRPLEFSASKLEGSQIVHTFPDEWYAFLDYSNIGEIGELYLPEAPLDRWITLKTYTKTLSEQGLSRFRGHIWYRQSFKLDKIYQGQEIRLLMSGIDDTVKVYVNGTYIDKGADGNFGAVDFDISRAVKFGEENVIVLDVSNLNIAELETGGIMRPVLIYIPNFTLQVLM